MLNIGRVLWWSEKDQNGIIKDTHNNEIYFDRSVLKKQNDKGVQANSFVTFTINHEITDCICAKNVTVSDRKTIEKIMNEDKTSFDPISKLGL